MIVWRLTLGAFAPGLDGEGARLHGGRWNSPGRPMVYTASSLSLAVLEVFVHLPAPMRRAGTLPDHVAVELDLDDRLVAPYPMDILREADQRREGDAWLDAATSLGLAVPSSIVPQERNVLLNPRHAAIGDVRVLSVTQFRLDPRLFG